LAGTLRNLLREPLVHFLVLGAGVFGLFALLGDRSESEPDEIVVGAGHIERMSQAWRKTRMRPPTQLELEGLIEDFIREEIYYREAMILGLDQDNPVIRRHLRQKMEFLSEDIAAQVDPTDEELQVFLDADPDYFRTEPRLSFRHIYFSRDVRGEQAKTDALELLAKLDGSETDTELAELGDSLPLPQAMERYPERDIASQFGTEFVRGLAAQEVGRWVGPVYSGFGLHLVFIEERVAPKMPELAAIRDTVVREWRESRRQDVNAAFYDGLRTRYNVVIERPEWLTTELNIDNIEQR